MDLGFVLFQRLLVLLRRSESELLLGTVRQVQSDGAPGENADADAEAGIGREPLVRSKGMIR